ncbi:MAG: hypothetical protein JXB00_07535, partial [Bacteroidales bacterium]|nr:hypothetical protein [Bacteroidales bacterium]
FPPSRKARKDFFPPSRKAHKVFFLVFLVSLWEIFSHKAANCTDFFFKALFVFVGYAFKKMDYLVRNFPFHEVLNKKTDCNWNLKLKSR